MLSTSGMLEHVEANPEGEFIVATETGMLYPLQQAAPQANLIEANRMAFCKYMKMITLPKLRDSLREMKVEVKVAAGDRRAGEGADRADGRDRLTAVLEVAARLVLGGVLAGASLAKLASPASSRAAMATFGIDGRRFQAVAWSLLIATELGLAAGVIAGSDDRGLAGRGADGDLRRDDGRRDPARPRRRAVRLLRRPLDRRLGRRSRATSLLAAAFAALPALPEGDLSTDEWLGLGLAVALLACAGLAVAVLALAREVGHAAPAPRARRAALEIAEEGPPLFGSHRADRALRARSRDDAGAGRVRLRRAVASADALEPVDPRARARPDGRGRELRGGRRGRRSGASSDPGQPVRGRARPRGHGAREGHLQQPRPARERARRRPSAAGPSASSPGRSVSEPAPRRRPRRPGARLARRRHLAPRLPRPRRRRADRAHRRRPGRQGGQAGRGRRLSLLRPHLHHRLLPAPDRACRGSTATATRCTPRTASRVDDLGRPVNSHGLAGRHRRQGAARPRRPAAAAGAADQGLRRDRRAIYGFAPHIDGGWYRCCGGSVRKLVDCCATLEQADQRRRRRSRATATAGARSSASCTSRPRCPAEPMSGLEIILARRRAARRAHRHLVAVRLLDDRDDRPGRPHAAGGPTTLAACVTFTLGALVGGVLTFGALAAARRRCSRRRRPGRRLRRRGRDRRARRGRRAARRRRSCRRSAASSPSTGAG